MLSLAEALAALPDTADGIAAHLTAQGIRGRRRAACLCPIAVYLTSLGMTDTVVGVNGISAAIAGRRQRVRTGRVLTELMLGFDRGEWPELVLDDAAEVTP